MAVALKGTTNPAVQVITFVLQVVCAAISTWKEREDPRAAAAWHPVLTNLITNQWANSELSWNLDLLHQTLWEQEGQEVQSLQRNSISVIQLGMSNRMKFLFFKCKLRNTAHRCWKTLKLILLFCLCSYLNQFAWCPTHKLPTLGSNIYCRIKTAPSRF